MSLRRIVGLAIAAAVAAGGRAQTLVQDLSSFATDTSQYDLVAFGNVTLSGSNTSGGIQGGIAVEGTLTTKGAWDIASSAAPGSNPSLYVNGSTLSLSGETDVVKGTVSAPNVTSGWTWGGTSGSKKYEFYSSSKSSNYIYAPNNSSSPASTSAPSGWSWSTELSNFEAINTALGAAGASGTISVSGGALVFTAPSGTTSGDLVTFTLNDSLMNSAGTSYNGTAFTSIQFDVPSGVNYVINVIDATSGNTLFGSGVVFNSTETNADQVLWNFVGSDTLTVGNSSSTFYGSILAPTSTITVASAVSGQVVAGTFTDSGAELLTSDFQAVATIVPETRDFALWAAGLCLVGGVTVRRRLLRA